MKLITTTGISLFLSLTCLMYAQSPTVNISISRDTVLLGNTFYIEYTFDSKEGRFVEPEIKKGEIIAQHFASSTSQVNGEIKAHHRQKYLIQPYAAGVFIIPSTVIKNGGEQGDIEIPSVEIIVKENPDKLEIEPENDRDWRSIDILKDKGIKRKSKKL